MTFKCKLCGIPIDWDRDKSYRYCRDHVEEGRRKEHEKEVENHKEWFKYYGETNADYKMVCPYCFHIEEDPDCLPSIQYDGEEVDVFCNNCEKEYHVILGVTYTFKAKRKKEEQC